MAVARKVLTLALMAVIVCPLWVYAEGVDAPVLGDVEASYDTTPTLTWTCESGPTKFNLTIGDALSPSVDAGTDLVATEGKWDRTMKDTDAECDDVEGVCCYKNERDDGEGGTETYYICKHSYELGDELAPGDITWSVTGELEADLTADKDDEDYTTDPAEDTFTIYGDVAMTLATDDTNVKPDETVTATVSMDSAIDVSKLTFSVKYDATVLTLGDVAAAGLASAIDDPTVTPGDNKVTVTLEGTIAAGTGAVATLPFTVADGAAATASENVTLGFVTADGVVESPVVADPENNPDDPKNPASWGDSVDVTVLFVPEPGDVNGSGLPLTIDDLIIALKVASGIDLPDGVDVSAYQATEFSPIGMDDAVFILDALK